MKKQTKLLVSALMILTFSCNNSDSEKDPKTKNMKTEIIEKSFGTFEGNPVTEYTLTNASGMQVGIINYGGTVTKIITPDKNGEMGDVILGYDSLSGFQQKANPYFNSLIGRYANRIANAKFTLDGKEYTLAANDHGNTLHGGNKGYDKVWWNIERMPDDTSLKLTYVSKDGEEGYPGNLNIQVMYSLTSDNSLKIDYTATTDKATPVNLTNHCYFNLSAGKDPTILNHEVQILADNFTPVNDKLIPLGNIATVKNTPMDFTSAKKVGKDIDSVKGGYDHNWVLNKKGNSLEKVANVFDPTSGRNMEIYTTEPGLQFYTGNFLDGTLTHTKAGRKYIQHAALCLETQHFPDSPNQPLFSSATVKPGETYRHTTEYKFSKK